MSERVSLRLDKKHSDIIEQNRLPGEHKTACVMRLLSLANEHIKANSDTKAMLIEHHENMRQMLAKFLGQLQKPFDQISNCLTTITNKLEKIRL